MILERPTLLSWCVSKSVRCPRLGPFRRPEQAVASALHDALALDGLHDVVGDVRGGTLEPPFPHAGAILHMNLVAFDQPGKSFSSRGQRIASCAADAAIGSMTRFRRLKKPSACVNRFMP